MRSSALTVFVAVLSSLSTMLSANPLLEFSFSPGTESGEAILQSLENGHRTEVHFEARVYMRTSGLSRLFGDRLMAEEAIIYEARWDALNNRYVVTIDAGQERSFEDPASFIHFLLHLDNYRLTLPEPMGDGIYLLCRAQIEPVRLVPPLTLMTFFMPGFRITTPWLTTEFRWYEQ